MESIWRDAYLKAIHGVWSHPDPTEVLDGIDWEAAGHKVPGMPHTIWQIARHMLAWDWAGIRKLEGKEFKDSTLAENYFPAEESPPSAQVWEAHKIALKQMPDEFARVLGSFNPESRVPEWDNITAAHLVMIVITHTSYHTAQIVALRRMLGPWKQ